MPSDPSDRKVVDFAQLRVTMLADTLRDLVDQIKFTNTHVARLTRDIGELRSDLTRDIAELRNELRNFRTDVDQRFDRMQRDVVELRGEQVLMANQILNAQQDARRALARIEDLLEARAAGAEGDTDA